MKSVYLVGEAVIGRQLRTRSETADGCGGEEGIPWDGIPSRLPSKTTNQKNPGWIILRLVFP